MDVMTALLPMAAQVCPKAPPGAVGPTNEITSYVLWGVIVLFGLGKLAGETLPERNGPPVEDLRVEKTVLEPGQIDLTLRNAGPDEVTVAQVIVNDSYSNFSGGEQPIPRLATETLDIDYPWIGGNPYEIGLLTSTGVVIPHTIEIGRAHV